MPTKMMCCVQDDPANAGLLKKRRALLGCNDEADEDDNDEVDDDDDADDGDENDWENEEDGRVYWDSSREEQSEAISSREGSGVESNRLDMGEEEEELEKHKPKKHHKKHKKKKEKKKKHHKKDRQQCRFLEGLTSSVVKFGTSSGDYLATSHGNNTCYQAVSSQLHHFLSIPMLSTSGNSPCIKDLEPCAACISLEHLPLHQHGGESSFLRLCCQQHGRPYIPGQGGAVTFQAP
jgi:hypothetical protein